jgi:hypothetical protein
MKVIDEDERSATGLPDLKLAASDCLIYRASAKS